jgi:GLPGLI family protein
MYNLIGDQEAVFLGQTRFKVDSLMSKANSEDAMSLMGQVMGLPNLDVNYILYRESNGRKNFIQKVGSKDYWHLIVSELAYKIYWDQDTVINNIVCNKATTHYKDIKFTLWFSTVYPYTYGPYLFDGLPGLVMVAYDDAKEHLFTLNYVKKMEGSYLVPLKNAQKISPDKLAQLRANPLKELLSSGVQITNADGTPLTVPNEKFKNYLD